MNNGEIKNNLGAKNPVTCLRELSEAVSVGIVVTDEQSRVLFLSRAAEKIFGYRAAEVEGKSLTMLMPDGLRQKHLNALDRYVHTSQRNMNWDLVEMPGLHKDGREVPLSVSVGEFFHEGERYFTGVARDITERKQAEERFRRVFEAAPNGMVMVDREGKIALVNAQIEKSFGYSRDELLGQRIEMLVPERFRARHSADRHTYKANPATRPMGAGRDLYGLRKDGSEFPVEIGLNPLEMEQGMMVLGTVVDITERKQAEGKVRRSEARYRQIIDTAQEGIWVLDAEARTSYVNRRVTEMLGYTEAEMLGRPVFDFMHEETRPWAMEKMKRHQEGARERIECRFRHKDGSEVWVLVSTSPIFDEEGEYAGVLCMATDITDRQHAEADLRASEERYRDLVENANDILYTHDLEGNYTSLNKAGECITGYTREEAIGMKIAQAIAPEYRDIVQQMIAKKLSGEEETTVYEVELIARDGRRVLVEANTRLIYREGVAIGVQGIARDVTERRQLEEQLRQSQKMDAVGRLAGGIAHDFNNLLTVINGYSQLMLRDMSPEDAKRQRVEEISKAAERAAALTRQILAFSRKQTLRPEVLDLNEVVSDMGKMLRRIIGEDIDLATVLRPALWKVEADPSQLEQIILNLAVNARDAMPAGGRLLIETANAEFDENYARAHLPVSPGKYVMLAVTDTGTGMPPAVREHIFEPFFTTKAEGQGTGLGLSTVYGIVKQSGGYIWVYSEEGRGTTFKIYLPRTDTPAAQTEAEVAVELPRGSETVLVVEDEEAIRELAHEFLAELGYEVLVASGGDEALKISDERRGEIHLLITDMVMPGMSGRELAARLSATRAGLKVLYISGYTSESIVSHGVLEAGLAFVQKPFALEQLAHAVRDTLDV